MRLPIFMAPTIEEKLSSIRTSDEASLATSVPFSPIAMPIFADLRAGASFIPSPVIATISLFDFNAFTIFNFCSGTTRAKTLTFLIFSHNSFSFIVFNSIPVIHSSGFFKPISEAIFLAVTG